MTTLTAPTLATTRRAPYYPVEPLLDAAARLAGRPAHRGTARVGCGQCTTGEHYTLTDLALDIGVHTTTPQAWFTRGGIPEPSADAAACAIGLHPALVWPTEWWQNTPDEVRHA